MNTAADTFSIYNTAISFVNNTERAPGGNWNKHKFRHYGYFYQLINMLGAEGFSTEKDPDVDQIIRSDYWIGKRGDLEFCANKYPNGFKIEFFQNVVCENPNGGRYDFDKFQKMPHIIRLQYQKYINQLVRLLKCLADVEDVTSKPPKLAEEWIKYKYVESCHHEQKDTHFSLRSLDGQQTQPPYNGLDRNKKQLHNGDIKYFRNYNGYLFRGRIYHNLNNMWWVIVDKYTVRNVASFELFDLGPDDKRGRLARVRIPAEYLERKKAIEKSTTKELAAELRRRGFKIKMQ